jgi:long-chain acyl-CoA synthetase
MDKLWSSICLHARSKPNEVAILTFNKRLENALTWKQLHDQARSLAKRLRADNIKLLAIQADNSPAWIVADVACSSVGIVALPLPSFFSRGQVQHALNSLRVDAVLTDQADALLQSTGEQFSGGEELAGLRYLRAIEHGQGGDGNATLMPSNTQKITFTSGSTGTPKGVCLSDENQEAVTDSLLEATASCAIERHLCVLPLATLLENIAGVHAPLRRGAQVVVADEESLGFNGASGFALHAFLDVLSRCRPNSMILIPQLLEALVMSCDAGWQLPDSLQFIAVGGATVSPALLERAWAHGLPVYEGYGLSECASVVTLNTPLARKNGTLGQVLKHTRVEIEDGEIIVNGPGFLGYVGDAASWSQGALNSRITTGDLGYFDAEGFLHYQGRRKNVLVSSFGRNISPEWVEAELGAEAEIGQCFVFGDSRPYCVALIAPQASTVTDAMIDAALVRVNAKLPSYARVMHWHRLAQPLTRGTGLATDLMTSNGRARRAQIEAHYQGALAGLYTSDSTVETMTAVD